MTFRVNIGCGMTPTEGWLNYDNSLSLRFSRLPELFLVVLKNIGVINEATLSFILFCKKSDIRFCDATKNIPIGDGLVGVLYSSHMLEHLDTSQAESFLREGYRILAFDGIVRIAVPGLRKQVDQYLSHKNADQLIHSLHTCVRKPNGFLGRLKYAVIGPRHHHWMYDEDSLCALLKRMGFKNPIVLQPGDTTIENPGALNLAERFEESIYVEARK